MSERYNPMASMSVVPRSRPVKDGVVGEEMGYVSDFDQNQFIGQNVNPYQIHQNLQHSNNFNNFTSNNIDNVNIGYDGEFNAFSAIEQAQMSSLEKEAELEMKLEREDPDILAAFQGVAPDYKYEDLEPSVQNVTLVGTSGEIPVAENTGSSIFGFMDTKNVNSKSLSNPSENVNFSNAQDLSSILSRLDLVEKNIIYLRKSLDQINSVLSSFKQSQLISNNFSEGVKPSFKNKNLGSLIRRSK